MKIVLGALQVLWVAVVVVGAGAVYGAAEGIRIEPGQWEMTSRSTMPMQEPQVRVEKECQKEEMITPDEFMPDQECTKSNVKASATEMSWDVACSMQGGGKMSGRAEFRSSGTTASGQLTLQMVMGGHKMEMKQEWSGKRLGPCE